MASASGCNSRGKAAGASGRLSLNLLGSLRLCWGRPDAVNIGWSGGGGSRGSGSSDVESRVGGSGSSPIVTGSMKSVTMVSDSWKCDVSWSKTYAKINSRFKLFNRWWNIIKQYLPLTFTFSQEEVFLLEMCQLPCLYEFAGISCEFIEPLHTIACVVLERKVSQFLFHVLGHKHIFGACRWGLERENWQRQCDVIYVTQARDVQQKLEFEFVFYIMPRLNDMLCTTGN